MHTISFKIDEDTKKKIENFIETEGLNDIEEFISKAIEDELFLHENLLGLSEEKNFSRTNLEGEEKVRRTLIRLAEDLRELSNHTEKVEHLATFDDFFKGNLDIIKEKFSSLVTGVLRSL